MSGMQDERGKKCFLKHGKSQMPAFVAYQQYQCFSTATTLSVKGFLMIKCLQLQNIKMQYKNRFVKYISM